MSENRREKSHRLKTFDAQSFIDTPPVFSCPTSVPRQKSLLANFTSGGGVRHLSRRGWLVTGTDIHVLSQWLAICYIVVTG
jgi:hypothetical protein